MTEEDLKNIHRNLRSLKCNQESKTRSKILLAMDENQPKKPASKRIVAEQLGVCMVTLLKVCKRYVTQGIHAALERKRREEPAIPSIVTG